MPASTIITELHPLWIAHKFGGSSLANASCYRHVAALLKARNEPGQIVVVSAKLGATNALIAAAETAARGDPHWREQWQILRQEHIDLARDLLATEATALCQWLELRFTDLADLLHSLTLLGTPSEAALALIQGLGEVFSARLLADFLNAGGGNYACLDARDVLIVRLEESGVAVNWELSGAKLSDWRAKNPQPQIVITGFVARDEQGRVTTLGRNGSDYSGAIFAALFNAQEIHIWTDVDGVLSADPRLVPDAVLLEAMSYDEACELAYFGAKVIHPKTMAPAISHGIPIFIRNTFRPELPGTRIDATVNAVAPIKGISTVSELAIINIEGAGMIGVPGTAERFFGALRQANVSVVMISQGSSEHSICCVIRELQRETAVNALQEAFARELDRGSIHSIVATSNISVLAIVGDGMAGRPGTAARLFEALAHAGVNVRAIAQGASERNISIAIESCDATRALRAVHSGFYLSPQTISIGLIGPGQVGNALLAQLSQAQQRLKRDSNLDLRIRAIANSRHMLCVENQIDLHEWQTQLEQNPTNTDLAQFSTHVRAAHLPHAVIIDCSASATTAKHYADWLAAGIHVITPNKHAGSGPLAQYQAIRAASAAHASRFRYETTVGAGLPIIQTARDLRDTGDEIHAIEGIFSGTLAWLFNRYDGTIAFSNLVKEAKMAGYTEPDPRDDLNGVDVARKLVILAREIGLSLELSDVKIESLVPQALHTVNRDEFMNRLPEIDAVIQERYVTANKNNNVLRFVARLDRAGNAGVGLLELPKDHAFAHIRLTDNIVQFTSRRYRDNPLVVQGPGAGPEVTAAGVFADLLRVAATLGAPL